jgi:probable addiction module antidote protein
MRQLKAMTSHHACEVEELRADRLLAVEYLKSAMESLDDPDERAAGLLALRTVAEAYGGLGFVAAQAGISRESLYRALSPTGNPTLKTLLAVLKVVGMRLSVEPEKHARV